MERFTIQDHGCKVNRYDGEVVRAELRRLGLTEHAEAAGDAPADLPADLVVLNACAVTDRAVQKGRQALRRLRRKNPGARMIVSGCMTRTDREAYESIAPGMLVVPSGEQETLRSRLTEFLGDAVEATTNPVRRGLDPTSFADRSRAFLKVQDGCDAKCAFCVIPSIRGPVKSRPRSEILEEARQLLGRGFRELVLCGVHLGHYGRDTGDDVRALILAISELDGDFRVRLSSLEATEVDARLAVILRDDSKLAPHLHVPMQSGDDEVLRAMRRPYTTRRYLDRLQVVKDANPGVALTTDVIVGFPGESDEAFENTLKAVGAAEFSKVHVFPFSPRAGTDAAVLSDRVPAVTKRQRVAALLRVERNQRMAYDEQRIGENARVLIEHSDAEGSHGLCGRYRRVRLPAGPKVSTFTDCRITGRIGDDLVGEPRP